MSNELNEISLITLDKEGYDINLLYQLENKHNVNLDKCIILKDLTIKEKIELLKLNGLNLLHKLQNKHYVDFNKCVILEDMIKENNKELV